MTRLYVILSVVGWAWLVLVGIFLIIRFTLGRKRTRGFDVIEPRSGNNPAQTHGGGVDGKVSSSE